MVNRDVLDYIPEDRPYGFDNLMLRLIQEGKKVWVKEFNGYWLDIGRPDDYSVANDDFEKISKVFLDE
jgi:NDP-sugar pyrophosphorylase family protein